METEVKFLDGLDVERELNELWNESLLNRLSSQRNYVARCIEEKFSEAKKHLSKTFKVSFCIDDLGGIALADEIVQELNDAHWNVVFENSTYSLTPCKCLTECKDNGNHSEQKNYPP